MDKPLQPARLEELRRGLRSMRKLIARIDNRALGDTDSLLSVAEAEVDRAMSMSEPDDDKKGAKDA